METQVEEIDESELLFESFSIDDPDGQPTEETFTRDEFRAAHRVIVYTAQIDREFHITVVDDNKSTVSRDVLATYKTLLYRSEYQKHKLKQLLFISSTGLVGTVGFLWFLLR